MSKTKTKAKLSKDKENCKGYCLETLELKWASYKSHVYPNGIREGENHLKQAFMAGTLNGAGAGLSAARVTFEMIDAAMVEMTPSLFKKGKA